tara:strand:+ start:166 stop:381 length:216 start_codon:yes stop_codon:yes gene_type:complete
MTDFNFEICTNLRDTARDYLHFPTKKNKNAWKKAFENYKKSDSTLIKSSKIRCYACGKMIELDNFPFHIGV